MFRHCCFAAAAPNVIPGPHCAARPFQVFLISCIARWNADAVFGGKGPHYRVYSAPLINCLNTWCQKLFGETKELLGLEYLFSQSMGESGPPCSRISSEMAFWMSPRPASLSTADDNSTVNPPAFEDACSPNPLPGFQKLETFCSLLVEICLAENKLSLTTEQRCKILEAWNAGRNMISSHRSLISCTGPTGVTPSTVGRKGMMDVIHRVKMAKRYAPAQQDIGSQHNRHISTYW
ncbi:uncharacterized protein LOC125140999 [Tachysurus fulvidraco]|uniref:uncharacterized protein LOC125140999 n=1 Tax=Tachysurus fulvidraco TaxID=1234273 RepID=UPI001FEE75E5|nr:uncharacterized protein LOC125140999 [Tachysurus fulvidraco]